MGVQLKTVVRISHHCGFAGTFNGSHDDGGGGSKLYARDTGSMSGPCNNTGIVENKRRTAACSIHTDNNYSTLDSRHNNRLEIQNLVPGLRRSERQSAARERKPIHLPSMRLREAFSSVFSPWLLFLRARSPAEMISSTLRDPTPRR